MQTNVPVGVTTQAGAGVTLGAFILAAVAFVGGARDTITLGVLATGLATGLTVLIGRYAQATAQTKALAASTSPPDDDEAEPADDLYPPAGDVPETTDVPADVGDPGQPDPKENA